MSCRFPAQWIGEVRVAGSPGFNGFACRNEHATYGREGAKDDDEPHLSGNKDEEVKSGIYDALARDNKDD